MHRLYRFHKTFWWLLIAVFCCCSLAFAEVPATAEEQDHLYLDKTQLMIQQINLLKKRLTQSQQELNYLQQQEKSGFVSFADDQANQFLLHKTHLHLASIRSSLEGVNIELTDSQQAAIWLEKNIQEIENQLNALNVFGFKLVRENPLQVQKLQAELKYQENLYQLERVRARYLTDLQKVETAVFQLYRESYTQINAFLKSRKMLHFKERQVKSELAFQNQQNYWLQQLDYLYGQMRGQISKSQYIYLENQVFYANENINLVYLKTLATRYQDQLREMKFALARAGSLSLLNSLSDQAQALGKQISRIDFLIKEQLELITKRGAVYINEHHKVASLADQGVSATRLAAQENDTLAKKFIFLETAYKNLQQHIALLNKNLTALRNLLDKSIQQELSARQGLPGFSAEAWLDLGKETLLLLPLSYKLIKGFAWGIAKALQHLSLLEWFLLFSAELLFGLLFFLVRKPLRLFLGQTLQQDNFIDSTKYLLFSVLLKNYLFLSVLVNLWLLFHFLAIPSQQYRWLLNLAVVWLIFRVIRHVARSGLVETPHDSQGSDVKLYRSLKAIFMFGAVITSVTVFLHQLPLIYEMKDLFDRLFLLLLLIFSVLVLRSWRVVPTLVLTYVEPQKTYLRRMIYFMGIFIPGLLFFNSLLGLFGFVNLVWMMAWYEGVFTIVLIAYFLLRGLLNDSMEAFSRIMISRVSNGWLWTEAFLKPVHNLLRVLLFFGAWMMLFVLYGWDQQSPIVDRLNKLMLYPLLQVLNTTITTISIFKLVFAIALFYWAARWTREFVFRLLLSKIKDLGIRNSIAILSQYAVVILGGLVCLKLIGIDLHALFLVASGLLIAISFGLRDLVNNFACGLLLLFERPIRVGDIVCVNNQEGRVMHIGGRAVTIRTWDHMEVIVPNTELFNKSFINWTVQDDIVRTVIVVKIDRQDNPYEVQKVIEIVLKEHRDVLKDPAPEVLMKDMIDNFSEFEIRYYVNVRQVLSRVSVRSEILFALWNAFAQHGIKAPNLQHEIVIKNQAPLLPAPAK